jgi:hypothetical protein
MNLQQTYYLPITANRPVGAHSRSHSRSHSAHTLQDLSSTLVDYVQTLHDSGNLNTNVPAEWQHDSAAAPTGASSLCGNETCYWDHGANCTTAPPSVTGEFCTLRRCFVPRF